MSCHIYSSGFYKTSKVKILIEQPWIFKKTITLILHVYVLLHDLKQQLIIKYGFHPH